MMHPRDTAILEKLAADFIEQANGDIKKARRWFDAEVQGRYCAEVDGPLPGYLTAAGEAFDEARWQHHSNALSEAARNNAPHIAKAAKEFFADYFDKGRNHAH